MKPRDRLLVSDAFSRSGGQADPPGSGALAALPPALRQELGDLLAADALNSDGFLESPALGAGFHAPTILHQAEADPPEPADTHPEHIGPWRVVSLLSDGDLAAVYLAEQTEPVQRRAAVKLLRSRAARREIIRRFDAERRSIALMDHPNVARLYDTGATPDGRSWFAMEYVDGEAVTAAAARLGPHDRLRLFIQACRGVEHAHQRGIIHRDIKPSNVLAAAADPGSTVVKVIDFGIARAIRAALARADTATMHGSAIGTLAYMSPEQVAGDPARIDVRTDVYGLGALLYELLAGRPAFSAASDDPAAILHAVLHAAPPPLPALPRDLAGDLRAIVERALEKDPRRRYASVADLRADVERTLAGLPVEARRHRPAYLARKFISRHRLGTLAAAVAIAGVAWGAWSAWSAREERCRLAMEVARSWFDQTLRMARTVGERAQRRPLLARLDTESAAFAAMAPGDRAVLDMRADVLKQRGDLELEEGWTRRAHDLFLRALDIRRALAAGVNDPDVAADLSIAMVRVGDAVRDEGRTDEALRWYAAAMRADEETARRFPAHPRALTILVWSIDRMASFAQDPLVRRAAHERQLGVAERLLALVDGVDERRAVAVAHTHLAGDAARDLRLVDAMAHAASAVEYGQLAVAIAPDNRFARHTLISALAGRSQVSDAAGQTDAALADAIFAVRAAQSVADADPDEVNAAWQLANILGQATAQAERSGDIATALSYARRRAGQAAHISRLQPTNPDARRSLAGARAVVERLEAAVSAR